MEQPCGVSGPLRFYCTAGRGLEPFLTEEVRLRLAASDVSSVSGKVFFTTIAPIRTVVGLRSAERLFLLLEERAPPSGVLSSGRAGHLIQESIITDHNLWSRGLHLWRSLRQSLGNSDAVVSTARRGQKRKQQEGECLKRDKSQKGWEPESKRLGDSKQGYNLAETMCFAEDNSNTSHSLPVTFRVCCHCSGPVARRFSSQDLGRLIGIAISKQLCWRVDLRTPDLEVNVHLTADHCVTGLSLLRLPLAQRSYIRTTGLRSTIAWAMASVAEIKQPGSLVLDPMCGVGAVLLEAAKECQNAFFVGMDINESQLMKARENVEFAQLSDRMELMQTSVAAIPLPPCSVDAVVCDVPFGRKFSSRADAAASLPAVVKEMERVLRVNGVLVLLLSPQLSVLLGKVLSSQPPAENLGDRPEGSLTLKSPVEEPTPLLLSLQSCSSHRVGLGAIDAIIHKYRKRAPND